MGTLAHEARRGAGARDRVTFGIGVMTRVPSADGKTRLAPHLSGTRLRALREALLADTLQTVRAVRDVDAVVFFTPAGAEADMRASCAAALPCVAQIDGDLGQRMCAALEHLLHARGCEAAILVGADLPLLTADQVHEARETLDECRGIVLGPADDGGYYLIGMQELRAEVFQGVEWGTASVLTDTLRAADRAGIETRLIASSYDIDTVDDLRRLEADLHTAPAEIAPSVRAWLRNG